MGRTSGHGVDAMGGAIEDMAMDRAQADASHLVLNRDPGTGKTCHAYLCLNTPNLHMPNIKPPILQELLALEIRVSYGSDQYPKHKLQHKCEH